jgi:hypothetical protein
VGLRDGSAHGSITLRVCRVWLCQGGQRVECDRLQKTEKYASHWFWEERMVPQLRAAMLVLRQYASPLSSSIGAF